VRFTKAFMSQAVGTVKSRPNLLLWTMGRLAMADDGWIIFTVFSTAQSTAAFTEDHSVLFSLHCQCHKRMKISQSAPVFVCVCLCVRMSKGGEWLDLQQVEVNMRRVSNPASKVSI